MREDVALMASTAADNPPWNAWTIVIGTGSATSTAMSVDAASKPTGTPCHDFARDRAGRRAGSSSEAVTDDVVMAYTQSGDGGVVLGGTPEEAQPLREIRGEGSGRARRPREQAMYESPFHRIDQPRSLVRWLIVAVVLGVLVAGCGSSGPTTTHAAATVPAVVHHARAAQTAAARASQRKKAAERRARVARAKGGPTAQRARRGGSGGRAGGGADYDHDARAGADHDADGHPGRGATTDDYSGAPADDHHRPRHPATERDPAEQWGRRGWR